MRILIIMLGLFSIYLSPVSVYADWELSLNVSGHDLKKYNEALNIQLDIQAINSPDADIYVAIKLPDEQLLFLTAESLFASTPRFVTDATLYSSNVSHSKKQSGTVLGSG